VYKRQGEYDPRTYREYRLSKNLDLTTVGHSGLGYVYNNWLYRARFNAMCRALRKLNLEVSQKSLIDIGVGSGAWIPFWQRLKIAKIVGLDITSVSIRTLRAQYPQFNFVQGNICKDLTFANDEYFDIATAFDIFFHITDDTGFYKAVENISACIREGGWAMIVDSFCHESLGPYYHEYHRNFDDYAKALKKVNLKTVHIEPIFFTMTTTICSSSFGFKYLLDRLTKVTLRLVGKLSSSQKTEWINHFIGCSLYILDVTLGKIIRTGPSLKILFAKKL
jgi:SAM-dependent methyltransferase